MRIPLCYTDQRIIHSFNTPFILSFQQSPFSLHTLFVPNSLSFSLISISSPIPMSTVDINHSVLISFVMLFDIFAFGDKFNSLQLRVERALEWNSTEALPASSNITKHMRGRAPRRTSALKISLFVKAEKLALCKVGTEQGNRALRLSLVVLTNAMKDGGIQELYFHLFRERSFLVPFFNNAQFLDLALENSQLRAQRPCKMRVSTAFEERVNVYAVALMSEEATKKRLSIARIAGNGTLPGLTIHLVQIV